MLLGRHRPDAATHQQQHHGDQQGGGYRRKGRDLPARNPAADRHLPARHQHRIASPSKPLAVNRRRRQQEGREYHRALAGPGEVRLQQRRSAVGSGLPPGVPRRGHFDNLRITLCRRATRPGAPARQPARPSRHRADGVGRGRRGRRPSVSHGATRPCASTRTVGSEPCPAAQPVVLRLSISPRGEAFHQRDEVTGALQRGLRQRRSADDVRQGEYVHCNLQIQYACILGVDNCAHNWANCEPTLRICKV